MKRLILPLIAFLFLLSSLYGQNVDWYEITPGTEYSQESLEKGLAMCDLTRYLQLDNRVKMEFTDGAMVELLSVNELEDKGIIVDKSQINLKGNILLNTFSIHPKGYILEHVKKWSKEELAKKMAN